MGPALVFPSGKEVLVIRPVLLVCRGGAFPLWIPRSMFLSKSILVFSFCQFSFDRVSFGEFSFSVADLVLVFVRLGGRRVGIY